MRHATVTLLLGLLLAPAVAGQDADKAARIKELERELVQAKADVQRLEKQLAELRGAKVYARDEFRKTVTGKTVGEVEKLFGRPIRTFESGDGVEKTWIYAGLTADPTTGRGDRGVSLTLNQQGGQWIVFRVSYVP